MLKLFFCEPNVVILMGKIHKTTCFALHILYVYTYIYIYILHILLLPMRMSIYRGHELSSAVVSMTVFPKTKAIFPKISTKYNCNLRVFPFNGANCKSRNSRKIPFAFFVYFCLLSRMVVVFFFPFDCLQVNDLQRTVQT